MKLRTVVRTVQALFLTSFLASALGQEVSIPDPGLNAAIRDALQKPTGPLTEQDLLGLSVLNAAGRNITSLQGLETARNLISLDLQSNFFENVSLPSTLTKLSTVDLSFSFAALRNCSFPDTLTNLSRVLVKTCALTNITLPNGLVSLVELNLAGNRLTSLSLPPSLRGVGFLGLSNNNLQGAAGFLTNLTEVDNLDLENNRLSNFTLPSRLTNIVFINLGFNLLITTSHSPMA